MKHRRSNVDIMGLLLNAAANGNGGVRKNKLMYKTFIAHAQLEECLPALIERELLSYDKDAKTFKTTQKGLRFLASYNQLYDTMKNVPSPIQQVQMQLE